MNRRSMLAVGFVAALAGCGADPMNPAGPEGLDPTLASMESIGHEVALMLPLADGAGGGGASDAAAMRTVSNAGLFFMPARCVSARANGATVTWTLTRCAGPLGLSAVTGTVTASYSGVGTLRPAVTLTARGLRANGAVFDLDTSIGFDFTVPRVATMAVMSTASGVGALGARFDRRGGYSLRWERDAQCITANGVWTAQSGYETTMRNYRRCAMRCPEPGGALELQRPALGYALTLSFPGGNTGLWQSRRGSVQQMGTFPIECQN